jgi:GMP synthase PP-ATPase subunit
VRLHNAGPKGDRTTRDFNAIRVPGEITHGKLDILRLADDVFIEEIRRAGLYGRAECNPACRFVSGADQASIFKAVLTAGEAKRRSWRQVMATGT